MRTLRDAAGAPAALHAPLARALAVDALAELVFADDEMLPALAEEPLTLSSRRERALPREPVRPRSYFRISRESRVHVAGSKNSFSDDAILE